MTLLLLEALLALLILIGIVWWTMFSGRGDAEARHDQAAAPEPAPTALPAPSPSEREVDRSDDRAPPPVG